MLSIDLARIDHQGYASARDMLDRCEVSGTILRAVCGALDAQVDLRAMRRIADAMHPEDDAERKAVIAFLDAARELVDKFNRMRDVSVGFDVLARIR
jgi:hypothetical protein